MLKIYAIPISLYCAKLRILMRHKNLEWEEVPPPGGYGADEYKLIIPSGNLPALVDGSLTLADSEAIAEYLNEKFPEPAMLPVDIQLRAQARERSRFHDTRLEPEVRKLFPYIDAAQADTEFFSHQSRRISARLGQLAQLLSATPASLGQGLTLGDCGFPITFTWIALLTPMFDLDIDWPDAIIDYKSRMQRYPAVSVELESYRASLTDWLDSIGA